MLVNESQWTAPMTYVFDDTKNSQVMHSNWMPLIRVMLTEFPFPLAINPFFVTNALEDLSLGIKKIIRIQMKQLPKYGKFASLSLYDMTSGCTLRLLPTLMDVFVVPTFERHCA